MLGLVSIIVQFVPAPGTAPRNRLCRGPSPSMSDQQPVTTGPGAPPASAARQGCAVAAHPSGKAATTSTSGPPRWPTSCTSRPRPCPAGPRKASCRFLRPWAAIAATQKPRSASWPRDFARKQPPKRSRRFVEDGRSGPRSAEAVGGTLGLFLHVLHRPSLTMGRRPSDMLESRRGCVGQSGLWHRLERGR
jgi:hypothetical protein